MSTSFSKEGSPAFNWLTSPPRHSPIVSGPSHGAHSSGGQSDEIVLTHESDYALTSQDNEIENTEKKRKLPTYNKKEDWEKFINNISDPKWLKKSEQAAEARSNVKAQYTGGRKGVPTRWNELFLAAEFMNAKLEEVRNKLRKEMQKNEALKAQLDVERQKNSTAIHGYWIPSSFPSSFGLCCLRNFRKKVVALAYVDTKLLIDDHYDCMIEEIIDPTAMLCDRDNDVVLGNVKRSEFVKWPKAYVTTVGEPSS
ncbi:hypothetical protein C5167_003112 [Papaver somniferum]|uniref:Uncharacterized protein n=1 Tax=Papaver somniferum TaxID=3469 RepID=A0A4Y7KZZ0_PAPSO|nr:hypothetical protein C5167_003112 [Papaver somniferum]